MNVIGGHPNSGLDWYRLLSIYSTLGSSKSNSRVKTSELEKELEALKSLNGDVVKAMQGISTKLDSLIQAGNSKLSGDDLTELKRSVVDGLKDHVAANPRQCADPVACDGESILFTDDVKEVLASLVAQKARVLQEADLPQMARDIGSIGTKLGSEATLAEAGRRQMYTWMDTIDEKQESLSEAIKESTKIVDGESVLFTDDVKQVLAGLVQQKAVAMRHDGIPSIAREIGDIKTQLAGGIPMTEADAKELGLRLTEADRKALADAAVAKLVTTGDPSTDAFKAALANAAVARMTTASVLGDKDWLYRLPLRAVRDLFVLKSDDLYLASDNIIEEACSYSQAVRALRETSTLYNTDDVVTVDEVNAAIADRYR
ncbi:unnamed protein product, partial [Pylaiella littoralis]